MAKEDGPPWWRGAVIYQVYVRSFLDSNGDGQGDLQGVEAKLDYIASLGVDAIWLSPIHPSPNLDWGYDVSDYLGVHPDYGTMEDFDRLLAAAHARGLRVLLDEVLAHTSDQHPWFQDSIARGGCADWYVWADPAPGGGPPNNWLSSFGGPAWTFNEARGQYFHHKFLPQQPKLNWLNREARLAALGVLDFWLKRGVDGFRLDVAGALAHDPALADNETAPDGTQIHRHDANRPENIAILDEVRRLVESHGPDKFVLGEFFEEPELAGGFAAPDEGVHSAYTFPILLSDDLGVIREHYEGVLARHPDHWPSIAFSNHDVKRAPSRFFGPNPPHGAADMLLALQMSLKGTVLLYQGEELGLPQAEVPPNLRRDPLLEVNRLSTGRDGSRTPMPWTTGPNHGFTTGDPWLPVAREHGHLSVEVQEAQQYSTLNLARALIDLRRNEPALRYGEIELGHMLAIQFCDRRLGRSLVRCAFNPSSRQVNWHQWEPGQDPRDGGTTGLGKYGFRIEFGSNALVGGGSSTVTWGRRPRHWLGPSAKTGR